MNFKENMIFKIIGFKTCCPENLKRRLCDFGLFTGERFRVLKTSVLKKVVLIEAGGFSLSLQRSIFDYLALEEQNGGI